MNETKHTKICGMQCPEGNLELYMPTLEKKKDLLLTTQRYTSENQKKSTLSPKLAEGNKIRAEINEIDF